MRKHPNGPKSCSSCFITFTVLLLTIAGTAHAGPDPAQETRDDMQRIGHAMEKYIRESLAPGGADDIEPPVEYCVWQGTFDRLSLPVISHESLEKLLVPDYLEELPASDAWGRLYEFRLSDDVVVSNVASILSQGSDGLFEGQFYDGGYTTKPEEDLIWSNFVFVRRPLVDPQDYSTQAYEAMGVVGATLRSWLLDQIGGSPMMPTDDPDVTLEEVDRVTHSEIVDNLIPNDFFVYTRCVPKLDPWGRAYDYYIDEDLLAERVLAIRTAGADGLVEGATYDRQPVVDANADLVWSDGVFFREPATFIDGFESGDLSGWSSSVGLPVGRIHASAQDRN